MKTKNYFRNRALMLSLGITFVLTATLNITAATDTLHNENKSFANAGYWIDAVVVTYDKNKEDKELFAYMGYFIDPVVVTYNGNEEVNGTVQCQTNHEVANTEASDDEQMNPMTAPGYWIDPVVITYNHTEQNDFRLTEDNVPSVTENTTTDIAFMKKDEVTIQYTVDTEGNVTNIAIVNNSDAY
jgi:hypothetical protein